MANVGQVRCNVHVKDQILTTSSINFNSDIISQLGVGSFTRVGIQAPQGTIASINGREIMIGRTEMYEVGDSVPITTLSFVTPSAELENVIVDYIYGT